MANGIFSGLIVLSIAFGVFFGNGASLAAAAIEGAGTAVEFSITMAGTYMLWLGLMEIGKESGLNQKIAKILGSLVGPLFPSVRGDVEIMGAISLNLSANFLGMGNAATPFGLRAMERMKALQRSERASNEMVMLIVINCSSILLIPTTIIALRQAAGSVDPFGITLPVMIATFVTTVSGILAALLLGRGKR